MQHLRAVILDLDDTLFDDTACTRAGLGALATRHGIDLHPDDLFARHAAHIHAIDPLLFRGEIDAHGARVLRFTRLLTELGVPNPDGEGATVTYRESYRAHWQLLAGANTLLHTLRGRGLKTAILTNYVREVQHEKLSHFGLDALVDAVLCIEDVPAPKPAPGAYHAACAALDVAPAQTVMVGDSWTNDVQGARDAGLHAVWINRRGLAAPLPDVAQVTALDELPGVLGLVGRAAQR
ncbi:HAD family hydrolase [Deinococcus sp. KSM4-11]|uniref:HAD family hydrolase n=1 Tax=Deinococcus sp. KSM4-11 TaxID=2568654 RepID=UPI0010A51732|nr:HAD family hydrolase [Deinococcus sp. KSM4-11]THF88067.1 HAD family hydrolase [Deinococcus sp. KSM4-11]